MISYNNDDSGFAIDETNILYSDGVERIVIFTLNNGTQTAVHMGDGFVKDISISQALKKAKQKIYKCKDIDLTY